MIDKISYYLEFDTNQLPSDGKIFNLVCKVMRTTPHASKNKLRLKYVKSKPYLVRNTEVEKIQLMELNLIDKKSHSNIEDIFMIGIVKIKDYNKVLTINGESENTTRFINNCIDEMTLNFLRHIGKLVKKISISNAGLMSILRNEDEDQKILYDRYIKK